MRVLLIFLIIIVALYLAFRINDKVKKTEKITLEVVIISFIGIFFLILLISMNIKLIPLLIINTVFHVLIGWAASSIATTKGRKKATWFTIGFFLGVVSLIILYMLGHIKICPSCKESIKLDASICRHCGSGLLTVS